MSNQFTYKELRVFQMNWTCPKCQTGSMLADSSPGSTALMSDPPQFRHICDQCGNVEWNSVKYPTVSYRAVDTN